MARGVNSRRGNRKNILLAAVAGVLAAGAFYAPRAQGAQFAWDTSKSGGWGTASNWIISAPTGTNTDQLVFGGTDGVAYTSTVDAFMNPWIINGLFLGSDSTATETINNTNTLGFQLAGTNPFIDQSRSGAFNISSPIALGGPTTLSGTGTGLVTLSGVISGSNTLFVTGGNWRLTNNNNSWSGGTTISGGVLELNSNNGDIPLLTTGTSRIGTGGSITINASTPGGAAELRLVSGTGKTNSGGNSRPIVFGANGGLVNIDGSFANTNLLSVTTSAVPGAFPAVFRFNGGPGHLSNNSTTDSNWSNGVNALRMAITNSGPIRVELNQGAMFVAPNVASLANPLTIRGVFGGEPSSGPNGTLHTGITQAVGRFDLPSQNVYTYAGGLTLQDALEVAQEGAARAIKGNITIAGTASGHPGNVSFFGRSTGTALASNLNPPGTAGATVGLNPLYIGYNGGSSTSDPNDNLIIQDGGIAALDLRIRSDQANHNGVLLNAKTIINAGGKLVFRQSISSLTPGLSPGPGTNIPVGYHIVQGNIQGEGTTAKESQIDLFMPFDNTVGDGGLTGGVEFQGSSNLVINGSGIGGLRVNGLSRPNALFGGGNNTDPDSNNSKVEAFLSQTRLAALTGSGGYLTPAPVGTMFAMAAGSDWSPNVTVGLRVVNSNTTPGGGDDVGLLGGFTHNILIENGATLNANNQVLGPAAVIAGLGRIWGGGTIGGGATIDAGGRIAPGTSVGSMAANGDLTLNGTYEAEVTDPANDSLNVTGTLTLGASSVLDLPVSNTYGYAPYTIATYGALSGTFGTVNGIPQGPSGPLYGVDYSNGQIRLVFVAAGGKVWAGSDGGHPTFWDNNTTANWNSGAAKYIDANHDNVTFDDTAASSNVVVTGGNASPSSVTVNNNSLDYTITSSGGNAISGTTGLVKSGAGKLTLAGPNTFNGTVRIKQGTVSVGQLTDSTVAGPLGTGTQLALGDFALSSEGTIQYTGAADGSTNRSIVISGGGGAFNVSGGGVASFSGVVSGDGTVSKRGPGIAALTNAANTFTGGINVDQGTLRVASFGAGLGPIALGVGTPGTLDYTGATATDTRQIFLNSAGSGIRVSNAATNLSFSGSVNGETIVKTGPGTLTLNGVVNLFGLNHTVAEGTLALSSPGNGVASGSSFTVPTGATLSSRPSSIGPATVKLTGGTLRVSTDASGLLGQFYKTVTGEITADNTGANAGGSSIFNSPGNFNAHFNTIAPSAVANTTATQQPTAFVPNNAGNGNPLLVWGQDIGTDFVVGRWTGKISLPTTGTYNFWTSSDDASVMFIDGVKVVDFNRLGAFVESPQGTVDLKAGMHDIMIAWFENAGGAGIEARWQPPGGVKDFLPNNVLLTTAAQSSASYSQNNVEVTASSSIDNPVANNSLMGTLTMSPVTLGHTGNGATRFALTTLSGAAGSAYTFNVGGGILDLGAVSGPSNITLNKSGNGNLVLGSNVNSIGASAVNVTGGNLVLVQEVTAPAILGTTAITLNTGATGLQLSSKGGDISVTNPIVANDNVRIAAFATDGGVIGPVNLTLGSATSGITVNGGKTITLSTDDDYNMNLAGAISGSGGITVASGSGVIDLVTPQTTGTLAVNAGTIRVSTPQTATVATTVGGLPNGSYATAQGNAVLTSPSLTLGNRGTWNANIPSGLPAAVAVNAGGILNANVANSLSGATVAASAGNAQFWVDGGLGTGSVTLSNNGSITGRVQEIGAAPANVRTLPTFAVAANQAGNLVADRDGAALGVAGSVLAPVVNMGSGSTLNLVANNNTLLHAQQINIAGGNSTLANSSSSSRISVGKIAGGTTALTVTGNRLLRVLNDVTAGNVVVTGTGINFEPGDTFTSHVASPVQVKSVMNVVNGTTDMGNNVISGDSTRYSSGLNAQFYQLAGAPAAANFNTLSALNSFYTATSPVAPFTARTTANGNATINFPFIADAAGTPPGQPFAILGFSGINTFAGVLRGQVYINGSISPTFQLRSDDGSVMFLAGNDAQFINNNGDHGAATVAGTTNLGGWQDVVIGYYENTGTAGLRLALGTDDDAHAVTNAMLRTVDPTGSFGGVVNVASNAQLIAGGVSNLGTINLNGDLGAASMTVSNSAPQSGTVSNINVLGTGVLTVGFNNQVNVENMSVPDGAIFEKDGPGTLRVTTSSVFGSGASVGISAGKLLLNGIGTGNGSVIVRSGGTLGGSGTMAGTASVQGGGHIAAGASVGTLTLGGLDLADGANIDVEGSAAGLDKIKIASDGTSDVFTLSGVTSINLFDLGGVAVGDYVIIDYNNLNPIADALTHLTISNPSGLSGFSASLLNDTANKDIVLRLSGGVPQWNLDANGSWGVAGNWIGGVPNSTSAVANFLGKITAARTVTLDGNRTVQNVNFDNANKYTIASGTGGTLTVGNGTSGSISVLTGTHEISAGLAFAGNVTKSGPGTLIISGAQSHGAGAALTVSGGRVNLNSNAGTAGSAAGSNLSLSIGGGAAAVAIGSNQDLKALNVSFAEAGTQTLDLASPAGAGAFNAINIYAADLNAAKAALYSAIVNANKAGAADQLDGIIDSGKHAASAVAIGVVGDHVQIRSTRIGDLNLDGQVTISDFIDLASNFNAVGKTWQEGDLNYDGSVTISDFIDLASNFNGSYSGTDSAVSSDDVQTLASFASSIGVDPSMIGSAVPEPGTLGLLAVGAMGLVARRRRRN